MDQNACTGTSPGTSILYELYQRRQDDLDRMKAHARRHIEFEVTDARGIADAEIMNGARRSTMDELAAESIAADKILVF